MRSNLTRSATPAIAIVLMLLGAIVRSCAAPPEGRDLKPRPDALEYALAAESLVERGTYAIAFEGVDYPPRYPPGFPVAAAPFVAAAGLDGARLAAYSFGVAAIGATAILGHLAGGPLGALVAGAVVAFSPGAVQSSGVAMSESASVLLWALTLAAIAAAKKARAGASPRTVAGRILLLLAAAAIAFATLIRYTNLALLAPLLLALPRRDPSGRRSLAFAVATAALALAGLAALVIRNAVVFGHPLHDGYRFWVPELYGRQDLLFSITYLVTPLAGLFEEGHLAVYGRVLTGIDPRLYGWPVAVLAALGVARAVALARGRRCPVAPALLAAALLSLPAVVAFHLLYAWQDPRFLEPLLPVVAALAAHAAGMLGRGDDSQEKRPLGGLARIACALLCLGAVAYGPLSVAPTTFGFDAGRWKEHPPRRPPLVDALERARAGPRALDPIAGASIVLVDFETVLARILVPPEVELVVADLESGDPHLARIADHDLHGRDGRIATVPALVRRGAVDEAQVQRVVDAVRGGARVVFLDAAGEGARGAGIERLESQLALVPLPPHDSDSPLAVFELKPR